MTLHVGRGTRSGRRGPNKRSGCGSHSVPPSPAGDVPRREVAGVEAGGHEKVVVGRAPRGPPQPLLAGCCTTAGVAVRRTEGRTPFPRFPDENFPRPSRSCGASVCRRGSLGGEIEGREKGYRREIEGAMNERMRDANRSMLNCTQAHVGHSTFTKPAMAARQPCSDNHAQQPAGRAANTSQPSTQHLPARPQTWQVVAAARVLEGVEYLGPRPR